MDVLKITNLTKTYNKKAVIDHLNMTVEKGDIYGFVGKNGAGKTTLMRLVLSLAKGDEGEISLFESDNLLKESERVGSLIETPALYKSATAYENIRRYSVLYGADEKKIPEILEFIGLDNTGRKKVSMFSLGMKQRLGIGIALIRDPEFLILDEPINGLDPEGISDIRNLLIKLNKERNVTILISSHLLDELSKIASKVGIISNGRLVCETTYEEIKKECRRSLHVAVDDVEKAKETLNAFLPDRFVSVSDNELIISKDDDNENENALINKELVSKGIMVNGLYEEGYSLEEYYLKKVGGSIE